MDTIVTYPMILVSSAAANRALLILTATGHLSHNLRDMVAIRTGNAAPRRRCLLLAPR